MKIVAKTCISTLLLMFFAVSLLVAANGKISGVIRDKSGSPVPGATVMLEGTRLGGFADTEGRYFVLNIPPGKYDVVVSAVGYSREIIRGVEVKSDLTTTLNISVSEESIQIEGVVIEAERKLVDKTLTASRTTISTDELSNTLPIASTYELLQTTPSVFRGYIRGSKQDQTKTIVGGIDVSDEYFAFAADQGVLGSTGGYNAVSRVNESTQSVLFKVNQNAVSELTVNTGAVGAEYVSATGGVINYSLREGGKDDFGGRVYFRSSGSTLKYQGPSIYNNAEQYFNEKNTLATSGNPANIVKSENYTYYDGKYEEGRVSNEFLLNLNGSVKDFGYFLSTAFYDNPNSRLPNVSSKYLNASLNLSYQLSSNMKLNVIGLLQDEGRLFGWKNTSYDDQWMFFLEGVPQRDYVMWSGSLKFTHFLSTNTYYEVQISNIYSDAQRGFCDDNDDGIVEIGEDGDFIKFDTQELIDKYFSSSGDKFFYPSPAGDFRYMTAMTGQGNMQYVLMRPGIYYEDIETNRTNIKADFTSQVNFNNQFKAGVDFQFSDISKLRRTASIGGDWKNWEEEDWNMTPTQFNIYAQDRMEYAGLIINLGLRFSYWDPAVEEYADYYKPFELGRVYLYTNDTITVPYKSPIRGDKVGPYTYFSPRLGVSHPISDDASVYFSFSKSMSIPSYSQLYSNYNFFGVNRPIVISPDRKPYYSTNYELGAQWSFLPNVSLNVNAYQKDILNYNEYTYSVTPRAGVLPQDVQMYYIMFNGGYANARGVELELQTLPIDVADFAKITARLSYTYAYIKGSAVVGGANNQTSFSALNQDSAKYGSILPFENINYFNKVEVNLAGGNGASETSSGYDREHRIAYTIFARLPYDFTLSSVGTFASGFYWSKRFVDDRVAGRSLATGPWHAQVDLRLDKMFRLSSKYKISLFFDIKNLFDRQNVMYYDNSATGQEEWELRENPTGTANRPASRAGVLYYDIPREYYFGISIDF